MSRVAALRANIVSLENNLEIYDQEISSLTEKINEIVNTLKDNSIPLDSPIWDTMLSYSLSDFSSLENGLLDITPIEGDGEIIDYSVTTGNLKIKETVNINGKQVNIYTSNKTAALYVITNGLTKEERKQLNSELKNHLKDNQMAIVTFHNDYYHYDANNKNGCTSDYAVVGKTRNGKMYSFETTKHTEIVTDDGRVKGSDTLVTSVNGMIVGDKMLITLETGAELNLKVRPQVKLGGGQTITEFERLSFSGGKHDSVGSEYASVYMEGEWQRYANTKQNKQNGTWINENNNKNVVTIGKGPTGTYAKNYREVGHVDNIVIPLTIRAGNQHGEQHMQGTVCYHHEGARPGFSSKDMLSFSQKIVSDWSKL